MRPPPEVRLHLARRQEERPRSRTDAGLKSPAWEGRWEVELHYQGTGRGNINTCFTPSHSVDSLRVGRGGA